MNFVKKYLSTFSLLFMLAVPFNTRAMDVEGECFPTLSSIAKKKIDELTQKTTKEITDLFETQLTEEKLNQAKSKGLISEESCKTITEIEANLKDQLTKGDALFSLTDGYRELKEKAIEHITALSHTISPKETPLEESSDKTITPTEEEKRELEGHPTLKGLSEESLKEDLQEIQNLAKQKGLLSPSDFKSKTMLERAFKKAVKRINDGTKTDLQDKLKKYNENKKLWGKKKNYLIMLAQIATQETRYFYYENQNLGLTLLEAYRLIPTLSPEGRYKKELTDLKKQIDKQPSSSIKLKIRFNELLKRYSKSASEFQEYEIDSSSTCTYTGRATVNIRGILYELEAALAAKDHGKTVQAFGKTLRIYFKKDSKVGKKIKELSSSPKNGEYERFLAPITRGDDYVLEQEFDLITADEIIECKSTNYAISLYKSNFKRQQFLCYYINNADKVEEVTGPTETDKTAELKDVFTKKPVICYVKYMNRKVDHTPTEHELDLITHGFTLWNGKEYHYALKKHTFCEEEMHEIESRLMNQLESIGPQITTVHIITDEKDQEVTLKKLSENCFSKLRKDEQYFFTVTHTDKTCTPNKNYQDNFLKITPNRARPSSTEENKEKGHVEKRTRVGGVEETPSGVTAQHLDTLSLSSPSSEKPSKRDYTGVARRLCLEEEQKDGAGCGQ